MKLKSKCGYDPYNTAESRVWTFDYEGREFYFDDYTKFFDPDRPKYYRGVDYPRDVSTKPKNPADWDALAPVANMNDPFDGFEPYNGSRRHLS